MESAGPPGMQRTGSPRPCVRWARRVPSNAVKVEGAMTRILTAITWLYNPVMTTERSGCITGLWKRKTEDGTGRER
ncbi:hypothetical protein GCM10010215_28230 [Streptomyces virginiae]|uniref:Transposase n=1 Tax=Streptomyces virginiae TaxID=1961 RepID=A0ABQ3NY57_STRVG|nr:hypothetical protein GCM10010215_28230 [Streptomyces virginiae]GHI17707.1 hypothetical protein Scinn_71700 [Streptomyces virginiae]